MSFDTFDDPRLLVFLFGAALNWLLEWKFEFRRPVSWLVSSAIFTPLACAYFWWISGKLDDVLVMLVLIPGLLGAHSFLDWLWHQFRHRNDEPPAPES